ncbi:LbtU family siderophore porin [Legionella sp. km772]|uniref:LbtU family siderophore porin n=1 Tax=Legionella sp. km772 TaxID=2498111 RepID=UPI000F8CE3FC|nr:LbtU family siderophore porin [Legionella sp. km772]RUR05555.1 LbtU family siderophore porin [Legionella sp. km772]
MNSSFIKMMCLSSVSLLAQAVMAASNENVPTSKNIEIRKLEERMAILEHKQKEQVKNQPIDPVLALPQAYFRPKYNTAPVYNQDLAMLKMRKSFDNEIKDRNMTPLPYPRIELGGSVIGVAGLSKPPNAPPINGRTQTDINLAGANFDVNSEIMDYLLGNMRISYDPNGPDRIGLLNTRTIKADTINTRIANSNIFLNTAFLTLGDLNKSPFYLTGGQLFLPFGEYGSSLLTAPFPARLGRMKQRPILLGFEPKFLPGFNASAFIFKGDSFVNQNSGVVNNGGANLSYTLSNAWFSLTTAGSYISNIADAGGMQNTGPSTIVSDAGNTVDNDFLDEEDLDELDEDTPPTPNFRGFGTNERLERRVPAVDARARLKLKNLPFSFYGEMVQPTRSFAANNASFTPNYSDGDNLLGATPSAWNAEGTIHFTMFENPSSFTLGYGHSSQALTFNLPQSTRGVTLRTTFKKVLTCSLGYQYDRAYPAGPPHEKNLA